MRNLFKSFVCNYSTLFTEVFFSWLWRTYIYNAFLWITLHFFPADLCGISSDWRMSTWTTVVSSVPSGTSRWLPWMRMIRPCWNRWWIRTTVSGTARKTGLGSGARVCLCTDPVSLHSKCAFFCRIAGFLAYISFSSRNINPILQLRRGWHQYYEPLYKSNCLVIYY